MPAAPSRGPGGFSMLLPPLATPAAWKAITFSGLSQAKPMVPPLAWVAALPSIGRSLPCRYRLLLVMSPEPSSFARRVEEGDE